MTNWLSPEEVREWDDKIDHEMRSVVYDKSAVYAAVEFVKALGEDGDLFCDQAPAASKDYRELYAPVDGCDCAPCSYLRAARLIAKRLE